jgi:hypothetical protein
MSLTCGCRVVATATPAGVVCSFFAEALRASPPFTFSLLPAPPLPAPPPPFPEKLSPGLAPGPGDTLGTPTAATAAVAAAVAPPGGGGLRAASGRTASAWRELKDAPPVLSQNCRKHNQALFNRTSLP